MKHLRKIIIAVLVVVLVVSGGYAIKTALDYRQEEAVYQEAQESFVTAVEAKIVTEQVIPVTNDTVTTQPVEPETEIEIEPVVVPPSLEPEIAVDFQSLLAVNSDVIGWIHIPDTMISYPLLQGETNQTYVSTDYKGNDSAAGSIFADYRVAGDFTAPNTVLYGHNMKSDTMFGELQDYRDGSFVDAHPYFFILTQDGYLRYEVCYALLTDATSSVYEYDFSQEGTFASHLSMLESRCLYSTGISVTAEDTIVTLSTCTGYTETERFVLVGRLAAIEIAE